jgi:hypothetical protein
MYYLINSVTKEVSGAGNIILGTLSWLQRPGSLGAPAKFSPSAKPSNFASVGPKIIFPAPDENVTKLVSNYI